MTERCEYVGPDGRRCSRGNHHSVMSGDLVGEHRFDRPETIQPIWWTPQEADEFIERLPLLVAAKIVRMTPPTDAERKDPAYLLGRVQTAAARYVKTVEVLFKYRDPWFGAPPAEWQRYREALARLNELAPPECFP